MKGRHVKLATIPSMEEVDKERQRLEYRDRYVRVLKSTIYALVVVAAAAVLLATILLPVLQVSGDSMNPTLQSGDVLLLLKTDDMKPAICAVFIGRISFCSSGSSAGRGM